MTVPLPPGLLERVRSRVASSGLPPSSALVAASLRERARAYEYTSFAPSEKPRDLMSVRDAAAEAAQNPGTQVVQEGAQGGGRWATVLRRRS